jgi:spermidine synthase
LVVEGDARLSFEDQPTGRYDMVVLDAFSSDAVPIHLLTAEAIADELRIMQPDGVIVFHISNRYYDLEPAIANAVTAEGLTILEKRHQVGPVKEPGETPSRWLAASRDAASVAALRAAGWTDAVPGDHPFTDDYADLLGYLYLAQ